MIFKAATLFEDGGRQLARNRVAMLAPTHQGRLALREGWDAQLRRVVRRAQLLGPEDGVDVLPPLVDAAVVHIEGGGEMRIVGLEVDGMTQHMGAQAWHIDIGQPFIVTVGLAYRAGLPIERRDMAQLRAAHLGKLSLYEDFDRPLRRCVRTASLADPVDGHHIVPPLRDAVVLWIDGGKLSLTGVEVDALTGIATAQSWIAELQAPAG